MKCYRIVLFSTLLLSLIPMSLRAQYDVVFNHYFDLQPSYNPSAAGTSGKLNVNIAYAMQMVGYENNPKTMYFAGDVPIKTSAGTHGFGIILLNDKLGLFSHQRLEGQYAYQKKLGSGTLGLGVQAGLLSEKFSSSGLDLEDEQDDAFSKSDVDGNGLDVGFGLYARFPSWYAGVSGQHLTYPTIKLGEYNEIKIDGTYYLCGGYAFQLPNPTLKIAVDGLVRSDLVAYRGDISSRLIYTHEEKMMYAGFGYSPGNSVTGYVGMKFQGIVLGYCYEAYTNEIGIKSGSHEIRIGYQTDLQLGKKGRNYHQSVRYL